MAQLPPSGGGSPRPRARLRAGQAPTPGGRGPQFWRNLGPRWKLAIRLGLGGFAAVCVILGGLVAYAALTLPNLDQIGKATGTIKIYDRTGKLIGEYGHDQTARTTVSLDKVSQPLRDATVATEDRGFYDEGAINFGRVAKALVVDTLARHPTQGASTITQQLAKLAFFGSNADKSPLRKLREALLANEIDRAYSKDQILEKYLNLIYYGHGAYGIENAAQAYFNKDAAALNLQEASLLAGLPNAPSYFDPFINPDQSFTRQHVVLASMIADGKASQAQADAVDTTVGDDAAKTQKRQAIVAELTAARQHRTGTGQSAPHFVEYVREQLDSQFADDPAITSGDLSVTTTLDLGIQQDGQQAVANGVKTIASNANNGALMMMDSHTGDILAMVGSADFNNDSIDGQFNVVTGQRRPGSSFKPYVYEQGFRSGRLKPDSVLQDTRTQSAKLGGVNDFDSRFLGPITAARSLLLSRNVSTEQAMVQTGVDDVISFAHSLGISTDLASNASTAIGTSAVKMIDHTAAYSAFSNGGHKVTPRALLKVVDGQGNTLLDQQAAPAQGDQVMSNVESYAVTKILRGYNRQWSVPIKQPTASKSGTTDSFVDAWYMSYSPDWVVATWAGHTDQTQAEIPMDGVFGTTVGKDITAPFINNLPPNSVRFRDFTDVAGSLGDCNQGDSSLAPLGNAAAGCPTPTPTPSPSSTPSPTPTPTPSETPTPTPTALPKPTLVPVPTPTPTPGG